MSALFPIAGTRTTGLLSQSALIQQLSTQQLDIQRLQTEISTGQRLATPSEDAPAALRSGAAPFSQDATGVVYSGNEGTLNSFADLDLPFASNASGADVFGTYSNEVRGTVDLNPALTANTPLSALNGGQGIHLESI